MNEHTLQMDALARVPKLALALREAGDALGLSPRTVEELGRMGKLRVARVGRRVLLPVAALQTWLADQAQKKGGGR